MKKKDVVLALLLSGILSLSTTHTTTKINNKNNKRNVVSVEFKNYRNELNEQVEEYKKSLNLKSEEIEVKEVRIIEEPIEEVVESYDEYLFELSFYCPCSQCCDSETFIMANGEYVYEGAIAAPDCFEFGTVINIPSLGNLTVCDRGGYIQTYINEYGQVVYRLDVFVWDHEYALELGRYEEYGIVYK